MRILIVSTFFPPLNSIASLRPYSWAKHWTLAGHEVTVLTVKQDVDPAVALDLSNSGYQVIEVPLPAFLNKLKQGYGQESASPTKGPSLIKRLVTRVFNWLRFRAGVLNACRFPDFTHFWKKPALKAVEGLPAWDLVISTAGPYTVHLVAAEVKRRGQAQQWIADYRDGWTLNALYKGLFPLNLWERWLEARLLKRADLVTAISDPMSQEMRKKFGLANVQTVANGFDPEDLQKLSEEDVFPKDGRYRIVHTGTIYLGKRDPTPLFQAIAALAKSTEAHLLERLEVLFVGPRQANLAELIDTYHVSKWVRMTGFVSREKALMMQRDAQALLFLAWNDPQVDGILTGKLFEYLYSGTPILSVGGSYLDESQRLILEAKAGQVLESVDAIQNFLKKALTTDLENPSVDPQILQRYDRKQLAFKLLEMVKTV